MGKFKRLCLTCKEPLLTQVAFSDEMVVAVRFVCLPCNKVYADFEVPPTYFPDKLETSVEMSEDSDVKWKFL